LAEFDPHTNFIGVKFAKIGVGVQFDQIPTKRRDGLIEGGF